MKNLASVVLFSGLALFGTHRTFGADTKNDPNQFLLVVHISASSYLPPPLYSSNMDTLQEIITATMNGKHYQLLGPASSAKVINHGNGLLNPGDYHARLSKDEHKTSYESSQEFEILFPDGTARRFEVIAQSE